MRLATVIGYLICVVAALVIEIISRRQHNKAAIPDKTTIPLGTLLDGVMISRPVRIVILVFWWWLGWHFLVAT